MQLNNTSFTSFTGGGSSGPPPTRSSFYKSPNGHLKLGQLPIPPPKSAVPSPSRRPSSYFPSFPSPNRTSSYLTLNRFSRVSKKDRMNGIGTIFVKVAPVDLKRVPVIPMSPSNSSSPSSSPNRGGYSGASINYDGGRQRNGITPGLGGIPAPELTNRFSRLWPNRPAGYRSPGPPTTGYLSSLSLPPNSNILEALQNRKRGRDLDGSLNNSLALSEPNNRPSPSVSPQKVSSILSGESKFNKRVKYVSEQELSRLQHVNRPLNFDTYHQELPSGLGDPSLGSRSILEQMNQTEKRFFPDMTPVTSAPKRTKIFGSLRPGNTSTPLPTSSLASGVRKREGDRDNGMISIVEFDPDEEDQQEEKKSKVGKFCHCNECYAEAAGQPVASPPRGGLVSRKVVSFGELDVLGDLRNRSNNNTSMYSASTCDRGTETEAEMEFSRPEIIIRRAPPVTLITKEKYDYDNIKRIERFKRILGLPPSKPKIVAPSLECKNMFGVGAEAPSTLANLSGTNSANSSFQFGQSTAPAQIPQQQDTIDAKTTPPLDATADVTPKQNHVTDATLTTPQQNATTDVSPPPKYQTPVAIGEFNAGSASPAPALQFGTAQPSSGTGGFNLTSPATSTLPTEAPSFGGGNIFGVKAEVPTTLQSGLNTNSSFHFGQSTAPVAQIPQQPKTTPQLDATTTTPKQNHTSEAITTPQPNATTDATPTQQQQKFEASASGNIGSASTTPALQVQFGSAPQSSGSDGFKFSSQPSNTASTAAPLFGGGGGNIFGVKTEVPTTLAPQSGTNSSFQFGQSTAPATQPPQNQPQNQFQAPASGGFNFGSTAASPAASAFKFGAAQQPSGTGGFNSSSQAANTVPTGSPSPAGNIFGVGSAAPTTLQQQSGTSSPFQFGQSPAPTTQPQNQFKVPASGDVGSTSITPALQFGSTPQSGSDGFKFSSQPSKTITTGTPSFGGGGSIFSAGGAAPTTLQQPSGTSSPFQFGQSPAPATQPQQQNQFKAPTSGGFNFGSTAASPSFPFGGAPQPSGTGGFSFSSPAANTVPTGSPSPAGNMFSIGAAAPTSLQQSGTSSPFQFGQSAATTTQQQNQFKAPASGDVGSASTPALQFGAAQQSSGSSGFKFSSQPSNTIPTGAPSFGGGGSIFNVGAAAPTTLQQQPGANSPFQFGQSSAPAAQQNQFGQSPAPAIQQQQNQFQIPPASGGFNFGSAAASPAFQFGAAQQASGTAGFNFSSQAANTVPTGSPSPGGNMFSVGADTPTTPRRTKPLRRYLR